MGSRARSERKKAERRARCFPLVSFSQYRYEAKTGVANKSTYWVVFELLWRDYFAFYAAKHGEKLFHAAGARALGRGWRDPRADKAAARDFAAWRDGRTGVPLIDANMRELAATGFMSNRGRQNVASYLVLDLGIDWRCGAEHFEELLVDYTPEANWGNWHAAAGLQGGRVNRFNPSKQGKDYDADARHAKLWIPELADVPAAKVHALETLTSAEQQQFGCALGADYPYALRSLPYGGGGGGKGGGDKGGKGGGGGGKGGGGRGGGKGARAGASEGGSGREFKIAKDLREREAGGSWGRLGSGADARAEEVQRKKARARKGRVQGAWAGDDGGVGVVG